MVYQNKSNQLYKAAVSANLGWSFEVYDLTAYVYAAPYFSPLFFPSKDYTASLLLALIVLTFGYFPRPLGAILFGHIGDKLGRKTAWFLALLGMGIATLLTGFLPTYQALGIVATVLLVILRISQGIFLGGEWAGGLTVTAELAPPHRRGFFAGIVQGGAGVASIFAAAALALTTFFAPNKELITSYGWRILFWFGGIILIIALFIRLSIGESELWLSKAKPSVEKIPLAALFRRYWKAVLIIIPVAFGLGLFYYATIGYFGTLLPLLKYEPIHVSYASLAAGSAWLIAGPFFGLMSDVMRNRKTLLILFYAIAAVMIYPLMYLFVLGSVAYLIIAAALFGIIYSSQYSIVPALIAENLDTKVRYSGIGVILNTGVAFSSFGPYISTYLLSVLGSSDIYSKVLAISIVAIIAAIVSLIFVIPSKDRAGQPLE